MRATELMLFNFTDGLAAKLPDGSKDEIGDFLTFKVATWLGYCWSPVLIPIGLVGNTLSFLVMMKRNNRKMSTCIYMVAISINDNILMLLALRGWFAYIVKIHKLYLLDCRIMSFLIQLSLQNTIYQIVAMTIDKFIAIKWPHKATTYSTPRRAKFTVIAIYICAIIYNLPHLFLSRLIGSNCVVYVVGGVYAKVHSWVTFTINGIIPFVLLVSMNLTIIHSVKQSHNKFGNPKTNTTLSRQQSVSQMKQRLRKNAENQLTVMLLLVTTLFLILMIPSCARYLYFAYISRNTAEKQANAMLFYYISSRLFFTNSGINFFLYCISGKRFREDVKEILYCKRNCTKTKKEMSITSVGVTSLSNGS